MSTSVTLPIHIDYLHPNMSLLNCVGCIVTWVTWVRGLRGLRGSNFYVGQHVTWVIIFTWVAWVKYIFAWVKIFCVGQYFYVCQNYLCELKNFCEGLSFSVGRFFCGGSEKFSIWAFTIIS